MLSGYIVCLLVIRGGREGRPEGRSHTKDWIGGGGGVGFEVCGVTLVLCTYYFPYFLSTPFFFFFFVVL